MNTVHNEGQCFWSTSGLPLSTTFLFIYIKYCAHRRKVLIIFYSKFLLHLMFSDLTPRGDSISGWGLWGVIGHEGGTLVNGISALIKGTHKSLSTIG